MIALLSTVFMTVLKSCIDFTLPEYPCTSMKSPTLYGFSNSMRTPPAKFWRVPLKAIPIATPADAKIAMKLLVSIPKIPIMVIIRIK